MKTLTRLQFDAARGFLAGVARPLEWALFLCEFEDGNPDDVIAQLDGYQQADGGFGRALEPDLRRPGSSVLATTIGLRILHCMRVGPEHEMVRAALRYVLDRWDEDLQAWPLVPPEEDEHPHAPWFDRGEDFLQRWNGFQANPRAEVLGYLCIWDDIVPDSFLCDLCEQVAGWLVSSWDTMGMHEVLCYLRLVEHPVLPAERRAMLLPALGRAVDRVLARDPQDWHEYCLRPLDVAPSPQSPMAEVVAADVPANLDFLIENQGEDGAWAPRWNWEGRHPDVWETARREWCGILTLQALRRLNAWGRISRVGT